MNVHQNARLTPSGRGLLADRVDQGWSVKAAAVAAGVSLRTASTWLRRHRQGGESRYHDRSLLSECRAGRAHRRDRGVAAAPAERLADRDAALHAALDRRRHSAPPGPEPVVGARTKARSRALRTCQARRDDPPRHQEPRPDQWPRPPHLGDRRGQSRNRGIGWDHLQEAVDDASRLASVEVLARPPDDATAFLERALAWFDRLGVKVERVMTDNGSAYRSKLFAGALARAGVHHIRSKLYTL